ncbi:hypothetical protein COW36_16935 [bacterium (Candidatus Blackallbacteria) CG17_big_fil_post_rev_8_21_14_2_50_48_46]|uniref:Rod shape-determining protein MreD n=1 Tax=bacterium (Candidatus Blackallbacteria) CG17_big_fil_post_rev_8_21_14_2_50_48_46 TaxID=2014261 RepID=A0A2M7G1A0_9BACT|nr:MAG: hypothetical protein COW64_09245 [bacterium (Candidatus Blackallbacteria) CG18_big_fil_WC_8_21_14_2_50_49_26]PIW15489.1 MAG: hypothetical protein COW36_16935 [bacterium (Candidatus Blackallbacteria) CG17_big_fil_post_rev_8_21_14_2_50_48_46]PIW48611.1 MAG: hypothetical protein COW20_08910 [bacterium (Candidatus Blackallbacteria) CG13_big_fil_rev_8_21_14_2_50_49_14]
MIGLLILIPGALIGCFALLQLQIGELLPWLNAPPQLVLMAGLLFTLTLPLPTGLMIAISGACLLDLWSNTPFFQFVIATLCLGSAWFLKHVAESLPKILQINLFGFLITLLSEALAILWFVQSGPMAWNHFLHLLLPLLAYHLIFINLLYLSLRPFLNTLSERSY